MDTIIERDNDSSAMALLLGTLAIAVIAGTALYFLQVYPFNAVAEQPATTIDIHLPVEPLTSSASAE